MNGQAIPGFYYDTEKKKYFKIQKADASRGLDLNCKYSVQNIRKREREERILEKASAQAKKARKERVHRQHASSLTQICQERELGTRSRSYYMHSSWPDACISGVSPKPKKVVDRLPGPPVRFFDQDPVSKTMYIVHGENSIKRRPLHTTHVPILPHDLDEDDYLHNLPLSFEPWDELQRTTSAVSSLTYLPATGALATTTLGSDRAPVVYLSDPERDGPYVGQQFTPKNCSAIWAAAARPTSFSSLSSGTPASNTEHLAVGASFSLLLFTRSATGTWDTSTPLSNLPSDVLALDWISHNTVALGCRDGSIRLYDARSGGSSHILTHPFPVSKIKRADDETRFVVSGLNDTLHLYDIRSPRVISAKDAKRTNHYDKEYLAHLYRPEGRHRLHKNRRMMTHLAVTKWSQPVLAFPHSNTDDVELDVAVNPRLGLVAAAQGEDAGTAIRVCNLWTGKVVREFKREGKERIRSMKWMDHGDGGMELWTTWNGGISRFAW
jgi:WD40 repeat protein